MSFLDKLRKAGSPTQSASVNYQDYMYPESAMVQEGMLKVSELHTVHWREYGNPKGEPVFFLHGGPGGGGAKE